MHGAERDRYGELEKKDRLSVIDGRVCVCVCACVCVCVCVRVTVSDAAN